MSIDLAVDCMGGDHGVSVTVPAALQFLARRSDVRLILVGDQPQIERALVQQQVLASSAIKAELPAFVAVSDLKLNWLSAATPSLSGRLALVHTTDQVQMDDQPAVALRKRKQSSMRVAIELVKAGHARGCVSAGNTGALMAIARSVLKMIAGFDRPAIAYALPNSKKINGSTQDGYTITLDLGANVDCSAHDLLQFAILGCALASSNENPEPSVGLLNIGSEAIKGNEAVKAASVLLSQSGLNFHGNVEGDDIYTGKADVVVCDGFVGNVALKTSEGVAKMISSFMKEEFNRSLLSRCAAMIALPVLNRLKQRLDPGRYNGAALLGLQGIVIKSHGSANALSFASALERTYDAVSRGLVERTVTAFEAMKARGIQLSAPAVPQEAPVAEIG